MDTTPGTVIIEAEESEKQQYGMIIVPETARQEKTTIGRVITVNPYKVGVKYRVWRNGKRKWAKFGEAEAKEALELVGFRVVLANGVRFDFDGQTYIKGWLDQVEGILEDVGHAVVVKDNGLPDRCQWCKSSGEANLLLDDKGYCIRCGLNSKGRHRSTHESHMSSDTEAFISGELAKEDRKKASGYASKEQIMSYSGQKNKRSLKTKN